MVPTRRVNLVERREILRREIARQSHEGRPEAPVHIADPVPHEPADQNVAGTADGAGEPEDFVALRVAPPAALYPFTRDGLGQVWHRTARGLENDAVTTDER